MKKNSKIDYLNIFLIIAFFFVIYFILLKGGNVFYGSTMDYANQHYLIPEYFRTLFYETKELIPSLALNLGMGQNIFNFSYYGLLNPIIMFSYLLPFITMSNYLELTAILSLIVSTILFYHLIANSYQSKKIRFITTFLFLMAAPLILHSHRHIMFINYMPFLLLGMFGVEKYLNQKKPIILMLSIILIITTSYFFSIPALIALFLYAIFLYLKKNPKIEVKKFIKTHLKLTWYFIVPILITGVLLFPTFQTILSNRAGTADTISLLELLVPTLNLNNILYSSYSLGLTSIFVLALINSIISKNKAFQLLGIVFAVLTIFPIFEYLLNGFMYLNAKVFIPFIPLGVILIANFLENLKNDKVDLKLLFIIFIIVSIIGSINYKPVILYLIEALITIIIIIIYNKTKKSFPLIIALALISFTACLVVNLNDELATKNIESNQYDKEITELTKEINKKENTLYRTVDKTDESYNSNNIRAIEQYKTTMYSSLTNKYFKEFYWYTFNTENPNRNHAIFSDVENPLFNIYFGNKYYLTNEDAPIGYEKVKETNKVKLYQNNDVFSLGYTNKNLMSEKEFNNLKYPYNIEALLNYTIVKEDVVSNYQSNLKEINKVYNPLKAKIKDNKYYLDLKEDQEFIINEPIKANKILIINFQMEYSESCKKGDTSITINNITNTLTCKSWKYHNQNYDFAYVLSPKENLNIKLTKGKYIISNIKVYELDYDKVKNIKNNHDELIINKAKTKGDIIEGSINVKTNSYLNLTIPYDKGYKIYVDNKETPYEKVNTSFIGFKINKGYHDIKIEYTAPWLNLGKIVSIIGLILFVITIIVNKRSKEK